LSIFFFYNKLTGIELIEIELILQERLVVVLELDVKWVWEEVENGVEWSKDEFVMDMDKVRGGMDCEISRQGGRRSDNINRDISLIFCFSVSVFLWWGITLYL